jgi:hypothetical protein
VYVAVAVQLPPTVAHWLAAAGGVAIENVTLPDPVLAAGVVTVTLTVPSAADVS